MLERNTIEFSDKKINALPFVEKVYSSSDWIKEGSEQGRLKIRVGRQSKTFVLQYNYKRYSLGQFSDSYGVSKATSEAQAIVSGEYKPNRTQQGSSFGTLAIKVFEEKERKGRKFIDEQKRKFRCVPSYMQNKPIHKIAKEDVIQWKESFLKTKSAGYWNKVIEVVTNVWNESQKTFAHTLLEGRGNPFANLKEEVARNEKKIPNLGDMKYLWRALNDYGHDMYSLIGKLKILTGMHFTEIQQLRVRHIQGDWLVMDIGQHKVSNVRNEIRHKIYLTPKVKELVNRWVDMCELVEPETLLFSHDGMNPLNFKTFNKHWNMALKKANLSFEFNSLRHGLITQLSNSQYDPKLISGHCYLVDTASKFYTDWDSETLKEKFREVNEYWQTKVYNSVNNMWF